jgi:hypothetical protein
MTASFVKNVVTAIGGLSRTKLPSRRPVLRQDVASTEAANMRHRIRCRRKYLILQQCRAISCPDSSMKKSATARLLTS